MKKGDYVDFGPVDGIDGGSSASGIEFKLDEDACEGDHGGESGAEFFITGCDASVGFEAGEKGFDAVTLPMVMFVKFRL